MTITTVRQLRRRATRLANGDPEIFKKYYNKLKLNHQFLENNHLKTMIVDLKNYRNKLYDWERGSVDMVAQCLENETRLAPRHRINIYEIWQRYYP